MVSTSIWLFTSIVLFFFSSVPIHKLVVEGAQETGRHHQKNKYSKDVNSPDECPPLLQPDDIGFFVINLDRSVKRLERMRQRFDELGLPQFERVPGVEYKRGKRYSVPLKSKYLKPADYGTALAHYKAWKYVYASRKRWSIIIEASDFT